MPQVENSGISSQKLLTIILKQAASTQLYHALKTLTFIHFNNTFVMKKNLMIYALTAMLASCGNSGDDPAPKPEQKAPIRFNSSINPMSKATDTGFESTDAIGVFAFKDANGFSDNGYAKNIKYIHDGSYFTSTTGITYPSEDEGLSFYAIYPYSASAGSQFSFSVNADQSSGSNYTQSDLMTSSTALTKEDTPNLKFDHRLCNIIINLEFDKVPSGSIDLSLSAKRNATANLITSSFASTGSLSTIKAAPNGTNSFKVILPPQAITEGTEFVNFIVNGEVWNWAPSRSLVFKSGMQYTYSLTVNNDTKTISFTGSINPWEEDSKIETVIPPTILDKMRPYITVYEGVNPPIVNGCFDIDPMITVYCEDENAGGYPPGEPVISTKIKFSNQNNSRLTLDYAEKSGDSESVGNGAFITGSGDNFTAFFDTEGMSEGISNRTALVISGTKTSTGIKNLRYAFVMVDKGSDPDNELMNVGVFRVFKDLDELARNANWNSTKSLSGDFNLPSCMSYKKP